MGLDLLRVVEPLHLHHHVAVPRLPQELHLADVGPVDAGGGQEDGAVADVDDLPAALDRAVEQLLGLALAAGSAVALVVPVPEGAARNRVDPVDVRLLGFADLKDDFMFSILAKMQGNNDFHGRAPERLKSRTANGGATQRLKRRSVPSAGDRNG